MIKVNSIVKLNGHLMNQLSKAAVQALEQTGEYLHTRVVQAQVVPRDTGNLQNEAFFVDYSESQNGKVRLVHNTPYARRLYFHPEYHFQKDENPNAKGKWFEDWEEGGRYEEEAQNAYQRLYRRLAQI